MGGEGRVVDVMVGCDLDSRVGVVVHSGYWESEVVRGETSDRSGKVNRK